MREPKRLYNFYFELQKNHIAFFPDLRFGQLMSNFFTWIMDNKGIDIYFLEEEKIIEYLKKYVERFGDPIV